MAKSAGVLHAREWAKRVAGGRQHRHVAATGCEKRHFLGQHSHRQRYQGLSVDEWSALVPSSAQIRISCNALATLTYIGVSVDRSCSLSDTMRLSAARTPAYLVKHGFRFEFFCACSDPSNG